jgi:hypothetical protein
LAFVSALPHGQMSKSYCPFFAQDEISLNSGLYRGSTDKKKPNTLTKKNVLRLALCPPELLVEGVRLLPVLKDALLLLGEAAVCKSGVACKFDALDRRRPSPFFFQGHTLPAPL